MSYKRVLFIGAHPDDIEIWAGGTILRMKASGRFVIAHVVLTDGSAGLNGTVEERKNELMNAVEFLKPDTHEFIALPDTSLKFRTDLPLLIASLIRKYKPDFVFTHSVNDKHPDHAAIGSSIMEASFIASTRSSLLDGEPHFCRNVLGFVSDPTQTPTSRFFVDISDFFEQKSRLIELFPTQSGVLLPLLQLNTFYGALIGTKAAEAFEIFQLVDGIF